MTEKKTENDVSLARDDVRIVLRSEDGTERVLTKDGLKSEVERLTAVDNLGDLSTEDLKQIVEDEGINIPKNLAKNDLVEIIAARRTPMGIGEVRYEGESYEVKGPGPEWERDENGGYANRG